MKSWVVWNYVLFSSLVKPIGCSDSTLRIKKFSQIFSLFGRVNLSRFVWLSWSISVNFSYLLKLFPWMSKWFDADLLSFMLRSFLLLLSLISNSFSQCVNILVSIWCSFFGNWVDKIFDKFLKWRCSYKFLPVQLVYKEGCLFFKKVVYNNHFLISDSVSRLLCCFQY